ncbi:MAG: hypothetical protein AAGA29_06960 [Planctomycetota bacterium]
MNTNDPHLDTDPQLDALLAQALAPDQVPADLQARILELSDPAMNALLDEALAPEDAPAGLETRILAKLGVDAASSRDETPAVLATIGPRRGWVGFAAAATIALATGLVFYATTPGPDSSTGPIALDPDTPPDASPDEAFASLDGINTELDTEIETLQSRILNVSDKPIWGGDDDFQRELWQELAPDEESVVMLF